MPHSASEYFSMVAADYGRYRPRYPVRLFEEIARLAPSRNLVWDCATGSGQAAVALAEHFDRVIATDASAAQLARAMQHPRVRYRIATAESSGLPDTTIDAVTVAQALHWFDLDRFYAEANRVLCPDGLVAVWTYGKHTVDDGPLDALVQDYYENVVGPYWLPERVLVETGYSTIPFPFDEIEIPKIEMEMEWSAAELLGYLRTWSSTARFVEARGRDPVTELEGPVTRLWGPDRRRVVWQLAVRFGRKVKAAA
jgi:SAM-dependent methyltransferase